MNIREAIHQTEIALRAYLARDERGMPLIPIESQRPIYLLGAPGVGKTAAAEEVARRLDVGLVSYTLTHHTRQSALGLPQIVARTFEGREMAVTEYTTSEIIAGVYRYMEETGRTRGILFLDEINCVSETLLPAIMELLQHKRFGEQRVPDGWMIVCAGNPEKFNRSARAFDPVALDRVRVLRVEPDLNAWLKFAVEMGVNPVIRSYLTLSPDDFYLIAPDGAITPRSWTDLSRMIAALETLGETPEEALFEQYLQCPDVCRRFSMYEKLCRGTMRSIDLNAVLAGDVGCAGEFAGKTFEETLFAAELLVDRLIRDMTDADFVRETAIRLSQFVDGAVRSGGTLASVCREQLSRRERALAIRKNADGLSEVDERRERILIDRIREMIGSAAAGEDFVDGLNRLLESAKESGESAEEKAKSRAENALSFMENALPLRIQIVMLSELVHCEAARQFLKRVLPERLGELEKKLKPEK